VPLFAVLWIFAGCNFGSEPEADRGSTQTPPPPPAYLKMPLDITFTDIPEVPEAIRNPSPPIKEENPDSTASKTP
jgi:hypothetical protein